MDKTELLAMVRARIGITSTTRDILINKIIDSVLQELNENYGIHSIGNENVMFMLVVDVSEWRFNNPQNMSGMPLHLKKRINDLMAYEATRSVGE